LQKNDSKNETLEQGATFAFGPKEKYLFFKKLQPKTFFVLKTIEQFSKNIFETIFEKNQKNKFQKKTNFRENSFFFLRKFKNCEKYFDQTIVL